MSSTDGFPWQNYYLWKYCFIDLFFLARFVVLKINYRSAENTFYYFYFYFLSFLLIIIIFLWEQEFTNKIMQTFLATNFNATHTYSLSKQNKEIYGYCLLGKNGLHSTFFVVH